MEIPYGRRTEYVPSSTPSIKAADLLAFQDNDVELFRLITGDRFVLYDDFLMSTISSQWTSAGGFHTLVSDAADDGFGALRIAAAGAGTVNVSSYVLPIGNRDFRFACRARVPAYAGTAASVNIVLDNNTSAPTGATGFRAQVGAANWQYLDALNVASGDTGEPVSSSYQLLEMRKRSNVLTLWIDGTMVYEEAHTGFLSTQLVLFDAGASGGSGFESYVDFVRLAVGR